MGLAVSLIIAAVGLILALAVHPANPGSVDVNTVGWILFAVGGVGMLLTPLFWDSWAGPGYWRRTRYVEGDPYGRDPYAGRRYGRRQRVVEEEDAAPPSPPY